MLPRGKVINRPVVTKLWVNGRANKDRDEWTEELRAHCEHCYDDQAETPEVQAERIRRQRISGDRRVPLQGRRVTITVDKLLRALGKMLRNKANGPADCLATDMLQSLPTETVYEVTHWFDGLTVVPGDRTPECVLQVYTTVLVDMLHEEKEPVEWRWLHVGAERGVNCEHMRALVQTYFRDTWNGRKTGGPTCNQDCTETIQPLWQAWT